MGRTLASAQPVGGLLVEHGSLLARPTGPPGRCPARYRTAGDAVAGRYVAARLDADRHGAARWACAPDAARGG